VRPAPGGAARRRGKVAVLPARAHLWTASAGYTLRGLIRPDKAAPRGARSKRDRAYASNG